MQAELRPGSEVCNQARHLLQNGDFAEARTLLERWLENPQVESSSQIDRAQVVIDLGYVLEQQGEFSAAIARYLEAEALADDHGDAALFIRACLGLARVQLAIGDTQEAAKRLAAVSDHLPWIDDPVLVAKFNHQLGMALSRLERFDEAEACLLRVVATTVPQAAGERATSCNSLGVLWLNRGNHQRQNGAPAETHYRAARDWFDRALKAAREVGDKHLEALVEGNIGTVAGSLGALDLALQHFEAQLAALRRLGDRQNEALALSNIGEAHRLGGRIEQAIAAQEKALAIGEALACLPRQRHALSELSACHEMRSDYAQALAYFKRFHQIDRQMRDQAAESRLLRMADRLAVQAIQREAESARAERDHLRSANEQLAREAMSDALTGLGNRRGFDAEVGAALARQTCGALVLVDLDHFKSINDCYGHVLGDRVLQRVAALLSAQLPPGAGAYRLGGDEFALWLPVATLGSTVFAFADAENTAVQTFCERLRVAMVQNRWTDIGIASPLQVSASIGYGFARADDNPDSLRQRVDQALYGAKNQGRNLVVAASPL